MLGKNVEKINLDQLFSYRLNHIILNDESDGDSKVWHKDH